MCDLGLGKEQECGIQAQYKNRNGGIINIFYKDKMNTEFRCLRNRSEQFVFKRNWMKEKETKDSFIKRKELWKWGITYKYILG